MAERDNTYSVEWEEVNEIEGESIFNRLERSRLDPDCEKELRNGGYHDNFVSYASALAIAQSNNVTTRKADIILRHVGDDLQKYFDSVVYIEVRQGKKIFSGTGFVIRVPSDALHVITNYHVAFGEDKEDKGNLVNAKAIQVVFFHDGVKKDPVVCPVIELTRYRSERTEDEMPEGDRQHLDYIILKVNANGQTPRGATTVDAQTMHKFSWEETARIQGMHACLSLPYIDSLVLVCIGHPHGAPKFVSFGELKSDPEELFREWDSDGENRVSVDHTCATCKGSSGSPVFAVLLQKNNGGLEVNRVSDMSRPYFLHYAGSAYIGTAMSFQSIAPSVRESHQDN